MDAEILQKVFVKLALVEDCLRRALDQLEDDTQTGASLRYIRNQVEKADDFLTDAKCIALGASVFAPQ